MALTDCRFVTDRMEVDDWSKFLTHDLADESRNIFLVSLLTDSVTRELPAGWQGPYDAVRAAAWFADRQGESTVLPIVRRSDGRPIGLLILSEFDDADGSVDIHVGYLMHEEAWGRGLATEVVSGFVDWCRAGTEVRSIVGGVADGNGASARVLQKNGFVRTSSDADRLDDVEYTLVLRS